MNENIIDNKIKVIYTSVT